MQSDFRSTARESRVILDLPRKGVTWRRSRPLRGFTSMLSARSRGITALEGIESNTSPGPFNQSAKALANLVDSFSQDNSPGNLPVGPPTNVSVILAPPPASDPPRSQTARPYPWESKAAALIQKSTINVNKKLGRMTWERKFSIIVRLKLLLDDGYDIDHLIDNKGEAKCTSDQATDAIEQRQAAKDAEAMQIAAEREQTAREAARLADSQEAAAQAGARAEFANKQAKADSVAKAKQQSVSSINAARYTFDSKVLEPRSVVLDRLEKVRREEKIAEDAEIERDSKVMVPRPPPFDTQPATGKRSSEKIKEDDDDEEAKDRHKPQKLIKNWKDAEVEAITMEIVNDDLNCIRKAAICDIFKSARDPRPDQIMSTLTFCLTGVPDNVNSLDFVISKRAMEMIWEELRTLQTYSEGVVRYISEDTHVHNQLRFVLYTDNSFRVEGDAPGLMGLMHRLQNEELLDHSEWELNEHYHIVREPGMLPGQLSDATQEILGEVKMKLGIAMENGDGIEIYVGQVN